MAGAPRCAALPPSAGGGSLQGLWWSETVWSCGQSGPGIGAIKGAIDNVVLGNLTLLLARFKSAIDATVYSGDRTSKNAAFVDAVARTHVQQSVKLVRERSPVLAGLEAKGSIRIVASMYDLASGKVTLV